MESYFLSTSIIIVVIIQRVQSKKPPNGVRFKARHCKQSSRGEIRVQKRCFRAYEIRSNKDFVIKHVLVDDCYNIVSAFSTVPAITPNVVKSMVESTVFNQLGYTVNDFENVSDGPLKYFSLENGLNNIRTLQFKHACFPIESEIPPRITFF